MTEIHAKLLEILKAFDVICKNHDAEYFLTGGSALGAIRHHGFIPWDDDIDVGMRRTEWNKIRPYFAEELPPSMLMVDYLDYPMYRNPIAKIVDNDSTVLYRNSLANECPKGQYIEIFLHDPVPIDKLDQHKEDFLLYCELMSSYFSVFHIKNDYKHGLKDDELAIIEKYNKLRTSLHGANMDDVFDDYVRRISQYREEESDYLLLEWGVNCCYYPLENFDGVRYEKFEDMMVPVARRACDNLRIDYGNSWMCYPPASAQTAHVTVGDANIEGDAYMKLIEKQVNFAKNRENKLRLKDNFIEMLPHRVKSEKKLFAIQMKQALEIEKRERNLEERYANGDYAGIVDTFASYIALKKRTKAYTFDMDIAYRSRDIIARSLVLLGRLSDAENVLDIPRNMFISEAKTKTVEDILRIIKATSYYYDGMSAKGIELLDAIGDEFRDSVIVRKLRLRIDLSGIRGILETPASDDKGVQGFDTYEGDINTLAERSGTLAEEYPSDMEALKLRGDALRLAGRTGEADELYDRVLAKSNNGMDILDIKLMREEHRKV